jgi:hypothetical protein
VGHEANTGLLLCGDAQKQEGDYQKLHGLLGELMKEYSGKPWRFG